MAYWACPLDHSSHSLGELHVPVVGLSHLEGMLLVALPQPLDQVASQGGGMSLGTP